MMVYTKPFSALITDFLGTAELALLSYENRFYVCQFSENKTKMLLNGSKSLLTAISMIKTITSEPFLSFKVNKQLDLQLPCVIRNSFVRPELTSCIVVGVNKNGVTLALLVEGNNDLSKAIVIPGVFSSILPMVRLYDIVEADVLNRTIKFN
jgi:hypothetical protein